MRERANGDRHHTLRHGEVPPAGSPRRRRTTDGYVVLVWKVAPRTYIRCLEHRWVMGVPEDHMHVHHKNGVRDDNRPENLEVITPQAHATEHRMIDRERARYLYEHERMTTPQIAEVMGFDDSAIYRALRSDGVRMRTNGEAQTKVLPVAEIVSAYLAGESSYQIAARYGVDRGVISRRLRWSGVSLRGPKAVTK